MAGAYGSNRIPTPGIDRIANEGPMVLEVLRHQRHLRTIPSHPSDR